MEARRLAIMAIKHEASKHPDEKVFYGKRSFTYGEIKEKIESCESVPEPIEEAVIVPFINLLQSSPRFRAKVLKMVEG